MLHILFPAQYLRLTHGLNFVPLSQMPYLLQLEQVFYGLLFAYHTTFISNGWNDVKPKGDQLEP